MTEKQNDSAALYKAQAGKSQGGKPHGHKSEPDRSATSGVNRRAFFSTVAAGSAVSLAASALPALAQPVTTSSQTGASSSAPSGAIPPATAGSGSPNTSSAAAAPPSATAMAAETGNPDAAPVFVERSGSDTLIDVLRALNIDYVATMPGSSFRGIHESIINYGGNSKPELLTCVHEEIAVAMAHGYAKIAGKPMAALIHGVVGMQHASMAVYNAWCDRVPILIMSGNTLDGTKRRQGVEWEHSALDNGAMFRDFTKWDAQPISVPDMAESTLRAYTLAVTEPKAPTLVVYDTELQEQPIPNRPGPLPRYVAPRPMVGDPAALAEAATLLVNAQSPLIVVDRMASGQEGVQNLVALAEALQAPVIDRYGRMNMPNSHYLNQTDRGRALVGDADVILGLELTDPWGVLNDLMDVVERYETRVARKDAKLIHITSHDLLIKANYQDFERYQPADLAITGCAEATLPLLTEAVRKAVPSGRQSAFDARGQKLKAAYKTARERTQAAATYGWDAAPISTARMCAEVWQAIRDKDWALVGSDSQFRGFWPQRLWEMTQYHQFAGGAGGAGVGYGLPGALGAALAHREHGRFVVNIQGDGDLMCAPGTLWTAVHHKIPMLTVIHNNRAYHQELMHVQRMADRHARGIDRTHIGTTIDSPFIDYATLARSMGMWSIGPITDPKDLGPALVKAAEVVSRGEPALVDVVSQGR